ncbi:MAG: hypothetical protein NXY57DRAFT_966193 [Lentinula lateritia]|nr:MAG: hypothetical protein NXY57DRAFT_966193 [Lentinula lateritia]
MALPGRYNDLLVRFSLFTLHPSRTIFHQLQLLLLPIRVSSSQSKRRRRPNIHVIDDLESGSKGFVEYNNLDPLKRPTTSLPTLDLDSGNQHQNAFGSSVSRSVHKTYSRYPLDEPAQLKASLLLLFFSEISPALLSPDINIPLEDPDEFKLQSSNTSSQSGQFICRILTKIQGNRWVVLHFSEMDATLCHSGNILHNPQWSALREIWNLTQRTLVGTGVVATALPLCFRSQSLSYSKCMSAYP